MPKSCCAVGCSNHNMMNPLTVTFHQFPSDPERFERWVNACKRLLLVYGYTSFVYSPFFQREIKFPVSASICQKLTITSVGRVLLASVDEATLFIWRGGLLQVEWIWSWRSKFIPLIDPCWKGMQEWEARLDRREGLKTHPAKVFSFSGFLSFFPL